MHENISRQNFISQYNHYNQNIFAYKKRFVYSSDIKYRSSGNRIWFFSCRKLWRAWKSDGQWERGLENMIYGNVWSCSFKFCRVICEIFNPAKESVIFDLTLWNVKIAIFHIFCRFHGNISLFSSGFKK